MSWGFVGGAAVSLIGSKMASDAQSKAARTAAKAAEFKPWDIQSGFGTARFGAPARATPTDPGVMASLRERAASRGVGLPQPQPQYSRGLFGTGGFGNLIDKMMMDVASRGRSAGQTPTGQFMQSPMMSGMWGQLLQRSIGGGQQGGGFF